MFVAGRRPRGDDRAGAQFNAIRAELGLPPDQPTTLLWMYCAETEAEAEEGWEYFRNQIVAAQHHYFEWNNPGFEGIKGYEEYLKRQSADVGVADAQPRRAPRHSAHRHPRADHREDPDAAAGHQPREGGHPLLLRRDAREKAEKSLRLFAEKVLPAVQAMPTPINPASLGQPRGQAGVTR